jgi:hypothetical protein
VAADHDTPDNDRLLTAFEQDMVTGVQCDGLPSIFAKFVYLIEVMERRNNLIFPFLTALGSNGMDGVLAGDERNDQHHRSDDYLHNSQLHSASFIGWSTDGLVARQVARLRAAGVEATASIIVIASAHVCQRAVCGSR